MSVLSANLRILIKAAKKAGKGLIRDFGEIENLSITSKKAGDFVSAADIRSEKIVKEILSQARPGCGFVLEESGEVKTENDIVFIVDPLDGTTNFLHGIPIFSVSIAMQEKGEIVAGVVYNPVADELYFAEKGSGAFIEGSKGDRRLRVSNRIDFNECIIGTGTPFISGIGHEKSAAQILQVIKNTAGVRRLGGAALDLCFVAAGQYDGFFESNLNIWDIAAGLLIVKEAGGYVSELKKNGDINNLKPILKSGNVLASNGKIHKDLENLLMA